MTRLALALILSTSGCAASVPLHPPARYDRPHDGPVLVMRYPTDDIRAECNVTRARPVVGCASVVRGVCVIRLAMWAEVSSFEDLRRHEEAHCNGWRHE